MTNSQTSGKERFKAHLRKVGSGEHTSKGMSREEAADALQLILDQDATPAQIGAFLIAHRIRRPEPQELTGMLDTYRDRGPVLRSTPGAHPPVCFGMPFDGRTSTLQTSVRFRLMPLEPPSGTLLKPEPCIAA